MYTYIYRVLFIHICIDICIHTYTYITIYVYVEYIQIHITVLQIHIQSPIYIESPALYLDKSAGNSNTLYPIIEITIYQRF